MDQVKAYYHLTKPGIIRGNVMVAAAAFLYASGRAIDGLLLLLVCIGIALVIASSCVANNILDRDIDKHMKRTKKRATVTGSITANQALMYAVVLGVAGVTLLMVYVNTLVAAIGIFGMVMYIVAYGYAKRAGKFGTLVGSISGATPPVAGYAAVTGSLDMTTAVLFVVMVCWQMPHFYAIAIFRAKEYDAASIAVLPLVRGVAATKKYIMVYIVVFAMATLLLGVTARVSLFYPAAMVTISFVWLYGAFKAWRKPNVPWARAVFGYSLITLLVWSLALSLNAWIV